MPGLREPIIKAFVLCEDVRQYPDKADLFGAGIGLIKSGSTPAFPFKHTFWAYLLIADEKPEGQVQLALMRADSGRRDLIGPGLDQKSAIQRFWFATTETRNGP